MRIIEQLVYKITGDNSEFDKSITQSEGKVNKFGSVADKMLAGVTVAAIGMVVKKMGDMVISSANALDRVDKLSQKIGLSRVAFQEWDYILGQSGASVEGLQMGIKTLSNAAEEARKGTALYAESFDKLGVSVTDTNGKMKDQEILFSEVFSALADMENQTERTAIANKLLGRSATELSPTLNTSKEEIEQLRKEAHDLGVVYSDEVVDAGVLLGDNIERLTKAFDGLKTKALAPIIGLAVTFTEKLLGHDSASKQLTISTNNLASATDAYKTITSQLKNPIDNLTESEKALLEIQQKRAELKLNQAIIELGKNYADTQREISNLKNDEEKYQGIIEKSLAVINKYTPQQREEIRNYVQQGRTITDMTLKKRELLTAEGDLERAQINLLSTQDKLIDVNGNFNASITQIAQGVIDQQVELSTLSNINADFAESVRVQVEAIKEEKRAIEARNKAIELAQKAFTAYDVENEQVLNGIIKMSKGHEDSAYWAELNRLATEKLNEVIIANGAETDKVNKVLDNHYQRMQAISSYSIALGNSYDANSEKASQLTSTIKALVDIGIDPESEAVADLVAQLKALGVETEEVADSTVDAFNSMTKTTSDAYAEMAKSSMSQKDKAMANIQAQADKFLEAGVAIADVAKWQSEQIQKYQDEQTRKAQEELDKRNQAVADAYKELARTRMNGHEKALAEIHEQAESWLQAGVDRVDVDNWVSEQRQKLIDEENEKLARLQEERTAKAKEEADKVRKVWTDASLGMLSSITSIWGSINQVQENQNQSELQRIKEQNEATLESARLRGASEEELTELEKSLQKDLNDTKNQYAKEESERKKAQATFSAIIDTASAIIGFLANPGGWAGWALSAGAVGIGAAQLAAINSAPVPSYDVGSIRIPETQTATVHKDEMILTAPQAEQARREGITIAPNKASGNSVNLVIYLDGKEIARNTIDNLNSGSVGTIKARVVK
jgi:hypothetical protein